MRSDLLVSFYVLVIVVQAYGEPASLGFVSIDCGISSGYPYTDEITNITYISDDGYISTGENHNISPDVAKFVVWRQHLNLRSFPAGGRNCYTIDSVVQGNKYNVRAIFMHGNYDESANQQQGVHVIFDLYIGVNFWTTVNITNTNDANDCEVIHVATVNTISVCLLNIKQGTPFISSLEVRPLKSSLYPAAMVNQSISLSDRVNLGATEIIRYPTDPYDRIWRSYTFESWDNISTASLVSNYPNDVFDVPLAVMQTAVTPTGNGTSLDFYWDAEFLRIIPRYFIVLHISDFQNLQIREFDIYFNRRLWNLNNKPYSPPFLMAGYIYSVGTLDIARQRQYNFSLNSTSNSKLPPILNAVEIYSLMPIDQPSTLPADVNAMMAIKAEYQVQKNWMGDPCLPQDYTWIGLKCSMDGAVWRITSLDLSNSGLHGAISDQFSLLKSLQRLNLSYNSLNGSVPDSLSNISPLNFLDLSGNDFRGIIPEALCTRRKLTLRYDTVNGDPCNGKSPKKKNIAIIVGIIVSVVVVLGIVCSIAMFIFCKRRPSQSKPEVRQDASSPTVHSVTEDSITIPENREFTYIPENPRIVNTREPENCEVDRQGCPPIPENREFTYDELVKITNNFSVCIGEGGFGPVFRGQLEDGTQVAVKMHSQKPVRGQGTKEFFAEVASLTKVHHRCLVSLVGYCKNKDHLALVYEYMPNGSLFDYLRDVRILSWRERTHIAHEAAQGLDYLHKGCVLPIIHRDVKSQNILLGQHMNAKISDFGLSKSFLSPAHTHVSVTTAAGTPGYMDPESFLGGKLTESSDVYSFGVVLLEIVTGETPYLRDLTHIAQRVKQKITGGNIVAVVDPRLQGAYDVISVRKVVDIALQCTTEPSGHRPAMDAVVGQLKEAVALEEARERGSAAGEISANWSPVSR